MRADFRREMCRSAGSAPYLSVELFDYVVCADALPMLRGISAVRQRLGEAFAHDLGGLLHPHQLEPIGKPTRLWPRI